MNREINFDVGMLKITAMRIKNGISNGVKFRFDSKFFQKKKFGDKTIFRYLRNVKEDLRIAFENKEPAVIFTFSYSALIKTGITLIAGHGYRVRSRGGHHIKILEKLSQILNDKNIEIMGDRMRKKRNLDLYGSGVIISFKETKDYLNFVKKIVNKAEKHLKSQNSLF